MKARALSVSMIVVTAITVLSTRGTMDVVNRRTIQVDPVTELSGPPSEGFQLSANVESMPTDIGNSLLLKFSIKNVTTETLRFVVTMPEKDYQVTIINEKGEPLPLTEYGRQRQEADTRQKVVEIEAGEEVRDQIPLSKMFDLMASGTYSLTGKRKVFKRSGEGFAEVVSNTVKFTVSG